MKTYKSRWIKGAPGAVQPPFALSRLAVVSAASLALALALSSCENVATNTQFALVRVIDASYNAPPVNVYVESTQMASNVGEGTISDYGTLTASANAPVVVSPATATSAAASGALVTGAAALATGQHYSVFLTDDSATPATFTLTVLKDQHIAAATGQSAFRFINQAVKTGAVDIYMVPSGAAAADAKPLEADLTAGSTTGYLGFAAQNVTMVIVPAGTAFPTTTTTTTSTIKYSSTPLTLTGGEVRTVMIIDSQLTNNPPLSVIMANDMN